MWSVRDQASPIVLGGFALGNLVLNMLNFFWSVFRHPSHPKLYRSVVALHRFFKMISAITKRFTAQPKKTDDPKRALDVPVITVDGDKLVVPAINGKTH